jgi:Mg-chelatase subunit ChlD
MFRFEDPLYLYLLLLIPLMAGIRFLTSLNKKKRLKKFGNPHLLKELMPNMSRWRPGMKFWLLQGVVALLIFMLARPQMGTRISHEKRTGIETIICLDISNSMRAEDVTPNRLDRAKMMVENLVDNFSNDKIGLIVFAGDAFVQLPITSDYVSAKMFLSNIDPSMMGTQGTDISRAIEMASHSFTQEKGIGKAIIVITDGEDHEGGATKAAETAKKAGMRVFMLGIGSTKGSPIPIPGIGGYMTDNTGTTVMSALNEQMCKEIAAAGGGAYIHVENNSNAQDLLDQELSKLSRKETQSTIYSDYDEQFQAFAILALLLIVIEICVLESKNPLLKNISLFKRGTNPIDSRIIMLFIMLVPVTMLHAQTDRQYIREGNKLFTTGDYAKSEVEYRKALEKNDQNSQALYNLGNALLAQNKDSAAVVEFTKAAKKEINPLRKSMSFHNMGFVFQKHKMFGEAIENYKQSLRLNPHDNETRYNLELCKRQLKQQKQDKKQQQNNQGGNKKKKDNQQQEEQKKSTQKQTPKMSRENAEQLLNAAMQQEKQTQERMNKVLQKPQRRNVDKNW